MVPVFDFYDRGTGYMNIFIVLSQMCVIFLLIMTGYFFFRKQKISDGTSRQISGLVVNLCNPAVLICSAFGDGPKISAAQFALAAAVTAAVYTGLYGAGLLLPKLLRIPRLEQYQYFFPTVFGNVGFLGIPLVSAVLGSEALIYVSINNLVYNFLFYIAGLGIIRKTAAAVSGRADSNVRLSGTELVKKLVNPGTVSAALTIVFYLSSLSLPSVVLDTLNYIGRSTTLLSMLVLGVSAAQMPFRQIFSHGKDYLFVALRMIALPILFTFLLKIFVSDPLILGTTVLLLAVPSGNLALMCSKEHGLDPDDMARLIILTTLLSTVTIPLVVLFV